MNITITKGIACHNGKEYGVGETIKQIKKEEGERLIKLDRAVEYVPEKENNSTSGEENTGSGSGEGDTTKTGTGDGTPSTDKEDA